MSFNKKKDRQVKILIASLIVAIIAVLVMYIIFV